MEFRILGPVQVLDGQRAVPVPAGKVRALLAVLLLRANRVVTVPELVDHLWEDAPPGNPRATIQTYVARLRQVLGEELIDTRTLGYRLRIEPDQLDVLRFRQLIGSAAGASTPVERGALLERALALWHGKPLGDVTVDPVLRSELARLAEERLDAVERLIDARLELGRHAEAIPELVALTGRHPLRERFWAQLMLALYRCGRQADALDAYRTVAAHLAGELGIDPGEELRRLHQSVLAADASLTASHTPERLVPRQLPAQPRLFAGRGAELARLTEMLDDRGTVVISAIGGAGGIGKTWLALHWAHRNADRFPDGQLYADLRGFDPVSDPVPAAAVLRRFLHALGAAPPAMADLDTLAASYRSLLAGRRMLVVLDNARDTAQVQPLLPGSPTCSVLVTSRNQLAALVATHSAVPLPLDVLDDDAARELLDRHLGARRVPAEPLAAGELLAWCAGLPLALGIVAARAATDPALTLAALAGELRDESARLDALDTGDAPVNLRAVFNTSYRALRPAAAGVFRLLGLVPGPDVSLAAAASLTALPQDEVRGLLRELVAASLVTRHAPDRYRLHDLVRVYAAEQAGHDPAAERRLVDFYLHTANAADRLLQPHRPHISLAPPVNGCTPLALDSDAAARAWFDAEDACLTAAQELAAARGWDDAVWQLAWTADTFRRWRGRLQDDITAWRAGLAAAQRLGDPAALALARRRLGQTCGWAGLHAEAIEHLRHAQRLAEDGGDEVGLAHTHRNLAQAHEHGGDDRQALHHAVQALGRYRRLGNAVWTAEALNAVGWYHGRLGEHEQARIHCEQALAVCQDHGHLGGAADALDSLGYIAHHSGRHSDAVDYYRRALDAYRECTNATQEAYTLVRLGETLFALGRDGDARRAWQQAIDLFHAQQRVTEAQRTKERLAAIDAVPASCDGQV